MKCNAAPYEGSEPFVFISYCHADEKIVYPYIEMLAKRGYRVWYDDGINPGDEWPEVIAQHLNDSTYFIAFISENSVKSHNCKREVNFAIQKRKAFMAVFLEEVKLSLGLEMALSTVQALRRDQYRNHEECVSKLCKNAVLNWCLGEANPNIDVHSTKKEVIHVEADIKSKPEGYSFDKFFLRDKRISEEVLDKKEDITDSTIIFKTDTRKQCDVDEKKACLVEERFEEKKDKKEYPSKIKYKEILVESFKSNDYDTMKNNQEDGTNTEKQIQYFDDNLDEDDEATMLNPVLEDETVLNPITGSEARSITKNVLIRLSNDHVMPLNKKTINIGRSVNDDYTIDDEKSIISRKHITLFNEEDDIYITDNESKNSTYVNGKRIDPNLKVKLKDCDIVEIGNEKFVYLENNMLNKTCNDSIVALQNDQVTLKLPSKKVIRIGRIEKNNDIIIKSNRISRNHALLVITEQGRCIVDLGSSNGTYVNGECVLYGEKRIIKYSDKVSFGSIEYTLL